MHMEKITISAGALWAAIESEVRTTLQDEGLVGVSLAGGIAMDVLEAIVPAERVPLRQIGVAEEVWFPLAGATPLEESVWEIIRDTQREFWGAAVTGSDWALIARRIAARLSPAVPQADAGVER